MCLAQNLKWGCRLKKKGAASAMQTLDLSIMSALPTIRKRKKQPVELARRAKRSTEIKDMHLSFDMNISPSLTLFSCFITWLMTLQQKKLLKFSLLHFSFPSFLCQTGLSLKSLKNIRIKAFICYIWYGCRKTQRKPYRKHSSYRNPRPGN